MIQVMPGPHGRRSGSSALQGRVVHLFSLGTVYPLGALLQGVLADVLGVRAVTVGGAVVLALALDRPGFGGGSFVLICGAPVGPD